MYLRAKTLDDLIRKVFKILLKSRKRITPSKGCAREKIGVLLELSNPRARLCRTESRGKVISPLGELLWYLAGSDNLDFIQYYIPYYKELYKKNESVYGAYGPRLFCMRGQNQIENVIEIIEKPDSRRAVIQLFNAEDIEKYHTDTPCTCTLQFMNRKGKLHMVTNMRSNDAFLGLPHDFFSFTMIQEVLARTVNLEIGVYKHVVGSLHLYEENIEQAKQFITEGWQSTRIEMPAMPRANPWPEICKLLKAEAKIRAGENIHTGDLGLSPYWEDLVRLLQMYATDRENQNKLAQIRSEFCFDVYDIYTERLGASINSL